MANELSKLPSLTDFQNGDDAAFASPPGKHARSASDSPGEGRAFTGSRAAPEATGAGKDDRADGLPPPSSKRTLSRQSSSAFAAATAALVPAPAGAGPPSPAPRKEFSNPVKGPSPHALRQVVAFNVTNSYEKVAQVQNTVEAVQDAAQARDAEIADLTEALHRDEGPKEDARLIRKELERLAGDVAAMINKPGQVPAESFRALCLWCNHRYFSGQVSPLTLGPHGTPEPSGSTFAAYAAIRGPFQDGFLDRTAFAPSTLTAPAMGLGDGGVGVTAHAGASSASGGRAGAPMASMGAGRGHGGAVAGGRGGGRGGGTFPNISCTFRGTPTHAGSPNLTLAHAYYGPTFKDVPAALMTKAVCNMSEVRPGWVRSSEYASEGGGARRLVLVRLENASCCQKSVGAWRARRNDAHWQMASTSGLHSPTSGTGGHSWGLPTVVGAPLLMVLALARRGTVYGLS
ncbi:hypothetical protein FB107DRAFT_280438 [Schizophyllum commune]